MNESCDIRTILERFTADGLAMAKVSEHEGGRNLIYVCRTDDGRKCVLRVSALGDRRYEEYLAETEFVRALKKGGAPVADVIPSREGRLVEQFEFDGKTVFASLFEYAPGMLIAENGYRYRENAPLSEYFVNTGKALGAIHRVSKGYKAVHRRIGYFDKYNMEYIGALIPDRFSELKKAVAERLERFRTLPRDGERCGLVHFDFSDGNYHVDMENGGITAFDFDNCMYCWYMFDLANLWTHGVGWCRHMKDPGARRAYMEEYFGAIVRGYRQECGISDEDLAQLPLFIDMVLIENIVDEFECCARDGEDVDEEDIAGAADALIHHRPFVGFF